MIASSILIGSAGFAFLAVMCRDAMYTNIAMTTLGEFGITALLRKMHAIEFVEKKDYIDTCMIVTATLPITLINVDFLIRHELISHQFAAPVGLCSIIALIFLPQQENVINWFRRGVIYCNCLPLITMGVMFDRKSYWAMAATIILTNLYHEEIEDLLSRPRNEIFLLGNAFLALLTVFALPLTSKRCFCWR